MEFTTLFFLLLYIFEIFHNKMLKAPPSLTWITAITSRIYPLSPIICSHRSQIGLTGNSDHVPRLLCSLPQFLIALCVKAKVPKTACKAPSYLVPHCFPSKCSPFTLL